MTRITFFSDAFTDSDGTSLTEHDPSWAEAGLEGGCSIWSNGFEPDGSGEQGNYYDITMVTSRKWNSIGPDQFAKIKVVDNARSNSPGVLVRCDGSGNDYLASVVSSSSLEIAEHSSGVVSQLATASVSVSNGDTISLEAEGSILRLYHNGSEATATSDTTHSDGGPGVYGADGGNNSPVGDDFSCGRISDRQDNMQILRPVRWTRPRELPSGRRMNIARRR